MRKNRGKNHPARRIVACVCIAALVICGYYMIHWNLERNRILANNAAYRALYASDTVAPLQPSAAPSDTPVPTDSPMPTDSPVPTDSPAATPPPATDAPAPTETPIEFEVVNDEIIPSGHSSAPGADSPTEAAPRPTPDENTIVLALETPPPVQDSFADLLAANPETVGFLTISDWMSLPVVQRVNDNEYYLKHNFEGESSFAGTLFLDGSNLLVPEDEALIVYGHNMRNGTMLAGLAGYSNEKFFAENAIVRFDTIYENRIYVPFAVFSVSVEQESEGFFNFRQFLFDETTFDLFALRMKDLSMLNVPIDVHYGDKVLLLVTCEYTHENGRLIVALRQMRESETEEEIKGIMERVTVK